METNQRRRTETIRPRRARKRALLIGALALSAAFALTACGGSTAPADSEAATTVKIAFAPVADFAPVYIALDKGYFAEEGLSVETQTGQNAAAVVPSVLNGQLQFAAAAVPPFLTAIDQGLPLVAVANASSVAAGPEDDPSAIVVRADSTIQRPKDLAGATVAVNQLGSLNHITAAAAINADGGDYTKTTFVAMPFPDMVAALDRGAVDSAALIEPFLVQTQENGGRVISHPNSATLTPHGTAVLFFTSQQFAQQNPETVQKFSRALAKGSKDAAEHPELVGQVLEKYGNLSPELFAKMRVPFYTDELSAPAIQHAADLMQELGMLKKPVDAEQLVQH